MKKNQQYINFYFQVHQPKRLRRFQFFDIGTSASYFDDVQNEEIIARVAANCYLPASQMLLRLIRKYPNIRVTFSLSGIVIEQLKTFAPEALESFRHLAETGAVEFLGETYYHSLACFINENEFCDQVGQHRKAILDNFGVVPSVFRNTELIYSNDIGKLVSDMGFKGIYLDGVDETLNGRSTNKIYSHPTRELLLMPRNFRLSDDVALRYSDISWSEWPLIPETFLRWINHTPISDNFISLGMDYETFGEHQKRETGIFKFMESLLRKLSSGKQFEMINPGEAITQMKAQSKLSIEDPISWADHEKDLSAWLGNDMQRDAFESLKRLFPLVPKSADKHLLREYRYLQTSDHFYYMSTKKGSDGGVHQHFSPYSSPYEAFMNYMNVLADVGYRLREAVKEKPVSEMMAYSG